MTQTEKLDFDKLHIWHPYTSMKSPLPVISVKSAKGVCLYLDKEKKLIDGMSSWWCAIHGYNNPVLNRAIKKQLKKMSHVMFGGIIHDPAIRLCKLLIEITPPGLDKIFLSDSGSVSVEVAMKMALQYYYSKDQKDKTKFLTIRSGYHGDTFNAMSVCDPITGMHHIFKGVLPQNFFAQKPECAFHDPWDNNDIESFKSIIEENHSKIAAVILEPIVQGAGGMNFYSPMYLKLVKELCKKHDVLLIADEIATGFGRTGELFACEHADITPDIMCLGKSLTGGYMTLAATLTTVDVADVISSSVPGLFMHGPTFMGNPLACSVAYKSIKLLLSSNWKNKIKQIETQMKEELEECINFKGISDVRVLGAIGVVETKNEINIRVIQEQFVNEGVWIRPFGSLAYIMPPYNIKRKDLSKLTQALKKVLKNDGNYPIFK